MDNKTLNLKFSGRRELSSSRKKTMYIYGIVLILIGLFGIYKSNFELNPFWYILVLGGIINVIHGIFGKELIKEKNSISISEDEIEYKNSFKSPQKIKINNLLDLRIETAKVEFVHNDHRVESYDFSVFQRQELEDIYGNLERVKANLIKYAW
ncbi:MAG: hypothetical protein RBS73_02595 [Prolixibacteraceae bacterium]|jgi:hypothetical protein|nr:hypothetical protein [Prolixibacteraceae bacterium]